MTGGPLALEIAWRYLKAPKTHGAVNAISIISVVGVAVATAAIVVVLSVFNGFRFHLDARLDTLIPDIAVSPMAGKTIQSGDSLVEVLGKFPGVEEAMAEVTDHALIISDGREMPITLKGVAPEAFARLTAIDSLLLDGDPLEGYKGKEVSVAVGIAQRLGLYSVGDTLFLFAPKRLGRVNLVNPASSFLSDSLVVKSVFRSMQTEFDENTIISDIDVARQLFQYTDEVTGIQIKVASGKKIGELASALREELGDNYIIKDRLEQQEVNFRMVKIEKWITFILLSFILVIASFNIISTLCMLIIDKGSSLKTLSNMGLSRNRVGRVFWWESILITLFGAGIGLIIGLCISLLQEKYGLLKLAGDPESLVIQVYPVRVEWLDLLITMIPIAFIGLITAWISQAFAKERLRKINS